MFPYEITPLDEELNAELMKDFKGERNGYVQVGPKKWFFPAAYAKHAENFYNFPIKEDDVWVITYPRSGTTLTQELVWLIANNLDYETAGNVPMDERFPFLEYIIFHDERFHAEVREINNNHPEVERKLALWRKPVYDWDIPSPRLFKTHLPLSLLPPDLPNKCKVIYVARNPKDVAVSYYHHNRLLKFFDYQGDFEKYWHYFQNDLLTYSPFWEHIKEGWEVKNKENVLFLFYEELSKNMPDCIRKVSNFLGKTLNEDDINRLNNHLRIDNFRGAVRLPHDVKGLKNTREQGFIRKGKVGGNEEYTGILKERASEWIKEHSTILPSNFSLIQV